MSNKNMTQAEMKLIAYIKKAHYAGSPVPYAYTSPKGKTWHVVVDSVNDDSETIVVKRKIGTTSMMRGTAKYSKPFVVHVTDLRRV